MHFNLKILNLLHSLCDATSNTPDLFRRSGYEVHVVEPQFKLANGRDCNPECILASSKAGHCVVVESKSGGSSSADQLQRYDTLTTSDLAGAGLDLPKTALKTADVVMFVPVDQSAAHIAHLDRLGSSLAVVAYDPDGGSLALFRGTLQCHQLQSSLASGLKVQWPPTPYDYIPFDAVSTDPEIASAIVNSIIAQALNRRRSFELPDICRDAIRYWDVLHHQQKKALRKRIERVVENLLTVGFPGQFQFKNTKGGFAVLVSPAAQKSASIDRNAFARRLQTMSEEALIAMQRKLDQETERGETSLFKDVVLPPLKNRRRRRP